MLEASSVNLVAMQGRVCGQKNTTYGQGVRAWEHHRAPRWARLYLLA
jgi:hypothetical protein